MTTTLLAVAVLLGCAAQRQVVGPPPAAVEFGRPFSAMISEHGTVARLAEVSPGQELSVSWSADRQVTFSVYYNRGDEILHALGRKRSGSFRGAVTPEEKLTYVFRWDNSTGHKVTFDCTIDVSGP